ncbi:MAG: hypothetical protein OXE99_09520 [Cellvibrionales bacterium]|nr:hypothetical protein [Cellvibrionales bacterium]
MNTVNEELVTNLSSRKLWQIIHRSQALAEHPQLMEIARKELIKRNAYLEERQFNQPH